ncbi:adenylyl-sulfate kinase [Aquirufa aurantiipilula]|uniref:adenylyl-sulfate kinase n=1 Tax=Aquirufa aurantiipilula TaxID=2696561 RepID=UPI001CAA587F|nr:adenylyl-sulfate kinase [Aquirufa aurantiipilula]MBZ1326592.1 adenylyl-sulfate kinase [Aquirufa aurantiipilula]
MVIWITGLSASGKTTLSQEFEKKYKNSIPNMVLLDGDVIRQLYGNDLGYKETDREIQIKRMHNLAAFLEKQSIIVLVAALYSNEQLLENNRKEFKEYFEVYLKGNIDQLQVREIKGLYKQALENKIVDVVGVDIPWNEPINPELIFDISEGLSPNEMAEILYRKAFNK